MTERSDTLFGLPLSGAVIDGPYRYTLWRTWTLRPEPALCAWVMLNPSTADAAQDDPTIRRCVAYARSWGYDGIVVRNLFALRATDPAGLATAAEPVGPGNDEWLSGRWDGVRRVVVAWGTGRWPRLHNRCERVAALLEPLDPLCLRAGRDGQPVHPLYQPADLLPSPWRPPQRIQGPLRARIDH
ncbi:DUF1643 domain-containing protein [Nonomuraea rosea]|uniref:DUF1643 domain-containing protein n=1 Tax=Nonomuraea rosea TaxID=638574 RepID=A0ABP6WGM9_9ACTN